MTTDAKVVERIAEDAPFDVPPFDEKEFIRKELISFKTTLVLFAFSIVSAGLSFVIWASMGRNTEQVPFPAHIFIALALGGLLIKLLFKLAKIDISHWKRKEWVGTFFLYFFFWLGFFLLFTNPPITDAAAPVIELQASPAVQSLNGTVELGAYVSDNVEVNTKSILFCIHKVTGTPPGNFSELFAEDQDACSMKWNRLDGRPFWSHSFAARETGSYVVFLQAEDKGGQVQRARTTFEVGDPFRQVEPPRENSFKVSKDVFSAQVKPAILPNLWSVQFSLDGVAWQHMRPDPLVDRARDGWWETDPSFQGWRNGTAQVFLRVVEQPYFLDGKEEFFIPGGTADDPDDPYAVNVGNLADIGTKEQKPVIGPRVFRAPGQTPGFGLPLALIALVGLLVVMRRGRDA